MNSNGKRFVMCMTSMLAAALAVSACIGCGAGGGTENAEVAGSVTFDGKPLAHGSVQLVTEKGMPAGGTIGPDGRFAATVPQGKGVPPGPCQIAVTVTQQQNQSPGTDRFQPAKWLIPKGFGSTSTSGLKTEIKPTHNELKIELFSNGRGTVTSVE